MPPNRQSVAAVLRTLSSDDLAGFVTESKYAPLTLDSDSSAPAVPAKAASVVVVEQQQHQEQQQVEEAEDQKQAAVVADNYWDEAEEEEQQDEVEPESYWGWPSLVERQDSIVDAAEAEDCAQREAEEWDAEVARREAVVAQVLAEEAARSVVSAANIEAHLIADAAKAKTAEPVEVVRNTEKAEEEGYWDWDTETDTQEVAAASTFAAAHIEDLLKKEAIRIKIHSHSPQDEGEPQQGYWDWDTLTPVQEKRRLVEKILQDERARLLLTTSHVEANLKNAPSGPTAEEVVRNEEKSSDDYWGWDGKKSEEVRAPHTRDPTHPANGYWDWTPPITEEDSRQVVIDKILADEAARQMLSATHIQDNLKSTSSGDKAEVVRNIGKSDNYWDWNADAREVDEKEVVRAPHTRDATHPNNKYWDWTPPVSEEESKAALIRQILADEAARRALSASHTEDTLKAETWSGAKGEVDRWYKGAPPEEEVVRGEEKEEEGYWDM